MINIPKMLDYDEGTRYKAYPCSEGFKTVGRGHNLDADPALHILGRHLKMGDKITREECEALFDYDLEKVKKGIQRKIYFFGNLPENLQAILINMTFQMGTGGVCQFKRMLEGMRTNNVELICRSIVDSKYYKQTPNRANRMIHLAKGIIPKEYL